MQSIEIDDTAILPLDSLADSLGVPIRKLNREIKAGRLAGNTRCGRVFVTGAAVRAWLTAAPALAEMKGGESHVS